MRVIAVVLQLLCYLVAADGEEVGGLQLHISETGLNKGIFMWVGTWRPITQSRQNHRCPHTKMMEVLSCQPSVTVT